MLFRRRRRRRRRREQAADFLLTIFRDLSQGLCRLDIYDPGNEFNV
jgi:hypothetical protein